MTRIRRSRSARGYAIPAAFKGLQLFLHQQKQRLQRKQFDRQLETSHADEDRYPTDGMSRRHNLRDTHIERRGGVAQQSDALTEEST